MLFVFDETELEHRQKLQMLGNMQLIVELFKHEQISSVILNSTIDGLMQDINDQNLEILCKMVLKLAEFLYKKAKTESALIAAGHKPTIKENPPKKASSHKPIIDLEYIDNKLQQIFKYRHDKSIESRIRFTI